MAISMVLGAMNIEADDPPRLARFWSQALGGAIESASPEFAFVAARPPDGFAMFFRARSTTRPDRSAVHLDLTVPWGARVGEVERLVALGATHRWDVLDEFPWVQWSTLTDPEGNFFCIAHHPPVSPAS